VHNLRARLRAFRRADRGSHSIEYVLVIGVGVALAAVLLKVVMSDATYNAMFRLVGGALG
jgi:Flp pilus assembly pilin Flp